MKEYFLSTICFFMRIVFSFVLNFNPFVKLINPKNLFQR